MRGRMPIDFQRLGIAIGQQTQLSIAFQRTGQIDQGSLGVIAVGRNRRDLRRQRSVRQSRTDPFRDIQRSGSLRHFFHASIRQFYFDLFRHDQTFSRLQAWAARPTNAASGGAEILSLSEWHVARPFRLVCGYSWRSSPLLARAGPRASRCACLNHREDHQRANSAKPPPAGNQNTGTPPSYRSPHDASGSAPPAPGSR